VYLREQLLQECGREQAQRWYFRIYVSYTYQKYLSGRLVQVCGRELEQRWYFRTAIL
jgi:hypothetical protein